MRCGEMHTYIQTYVDGFLSSAARHHCDEHLANCPRCRQTTLRAQQITELIRVDALPPMPPAFTAHVLQRAHAQATDAVVPRTFGLKSGWRVFGMRMATAVAVGIVIFVGIIMERDVSMPTTESTQTTTVNTTDLYHLDYLTETPRGSISQVYYTLDAPSSARGSDR